MNHAERILVVINHGDETPYVLEKAAVLAHAENAVVQVVRMIHEDLVEFRHMPADDAQALKLHIMQAEEKYLVGLVDEYRERFRDIETFTLWNKRVSEGAVHAAQKFEADLIVKAVDAASPGFARHPDDWNLLRHAECPVMLVSPHPWQQHPVVLGAADLMDDLHDDLNDAILTTGAHIAAELDGLFHVACAYPSLTTWANTEVNFGVDLTRMESGVRDIASTKLDQLSGGTFDEKHLHVQAGKPVDAVKAVFDELHPEIVVIGTAARKGISGLILGNTSEALLGAIECDLLVVNG